MWLAGQQNSFDTGLPVNDRTGNPLIFTANIPDADAANEAHGVRFNKFPPLPSATGGCGMPNDFPFFRLSEMYLIKAEALNEQGQCRGRHRGNRHGSQSAAIARRILFPPE